MHSTGTSSLSHDLTSSLHDGSLETRSHCSGDDHCHDLELELEVERTQLTSTCDGGDWKQTPVLRHSYGFSIMLHSLQLYHWLCRFYSSRYLVFGLRLKNLQWVFSIEFVLFESLSIRFKSRHCKIVRFILKHTDFWLNGWNSHQNHEN